MNAIQMNHVSKRFKTFTLNDITLSLPEGYIMGLIGANGAGKTTIIKLLMGLYLKSEGDIQVLGLDPIKEGKDMRNQVGYVFDDPKYYDFKLKKIIKIISLFYSDWDETIFNNYMNRFGLKNQMKFKELSRGMKLKFALAISLSHHAKVLVLDEPTSGLDPIFRLELLDILQEVIEDGTKSILFSSHITSDVEKIADYITYIRNGKIIISKDRNTLLTDYLLVKGSTNKIPETVSDVMIGAKVTPYNYEALIPNNHQIKVVWEQEEPPNLEQIMFYLEKGGDNNAKVNL